MKKSAIVLSLSLSFVLAACGGGGDGGSTGGGGGDDSSSGQTLPPGGSPTPSPKPSAQYEVRRDLKVRDLIVPASINVDTCDSTWLVTVDNKLYVAPAAKNPGELTGRCGGLGELTDNLPADGALHLVMTDVAEVHRHRGTVLILKSDGTLLGVGQNDSGQLNQSRITMPSTRKLIEITKDAVSARIHTDYDGNTLLVLKKDGRVYAAGKGLSTMKALNTYVQSDMYRLDGYETRLRDIGVTNVVKLSRVYDARNLGGLNTIAMLRNDGSVWYFAGESVYTAYERDVYKIDDSQSAADGYVSFTNNTVAYLNGSPELYFSVKKNALSLASNNVYNSFYNSRNCVLLRSETGQVRMTSDTNWCFGSSSDRPIYEQVVFNGARDVMGRNNSLFVQGNDSILYLAGYYPLGADPVTANNEKDTFLPGETDLYGRTITFKYKPVPWLLAK